MKVKHIEDIERYLQEQMSQNEKQSFESTLVKNPTLQAEVNRIESLIKGVELNGKLDLMRQMDKWEESIQQDSSDQNDDLTNSLVNKSLKRPINMFVLIAASIVLLVSALFNILDNDEPSDVFVNQYDHYSSNRRIIRGANNSTLKTNETKAYNLYEIKEYSLAAPLLVENFKNSNNSDDLFYAALCYLYIGEKGNAHKLLNQVNLSERQKTYLLEHNMLAN